MVISHTCLSLERPEVVLRVTFVLGEETGEQLLLCICPLLPTILWAGKHVYFKAQ
jgi:hypothetical protein